MTDPNKDLDPLLDGTVLIADLLGFQHLFTGAQFRPLNYFDVLNRAVKNHTGKIWLHAGGASAIVFAPEATDTAVRAIHAARQLHEETREDLPSTMSITTAIATGRLYAGFIGPQDCRLPTLLGPAYQLANKRFAIAPKERSSICFCDETNRRISNMYPTRRIADIAWSFV